ncbi:hypothetical protein HanPI659440_Chr04g0165291 [Helianthus annuus]|nr:hypothetical protein HanPI659440_Chr04g0165291 [Helianthus annuus]
MSSHSNPPPHLSLSWRFRNPKLSSPDLFENLLSSPDLGFLHVIQDLAIAVFSLKRDLEFLHTLQDLAFTVRFDTFQIEIPFSIFVLSLPQRSGFGSVDPKGKTIRDVRLPQKSLCTFIYIHLVRAEPCKTQNFIQMMFVSALNLQI